MAVATKVVGIAGTPPQSFPSFGLQGVIFVPGSGSFFRVTSPENSEVPSASVVVVAEMRSPIFTTFATRTEKFPPLGITILVNR